MRYEQRIIDAFESSTIETVLLIDDAYDSPEITDNAIGELIGFLENETGRIMCAELGIENDAFESASEAALEGETDNEHLQAVYRALYAEFVRTDDQKYDLGGHFQNHKGTALGVLRALYDLLQKCKVNVHIAGLENGLTSYLQLRPQVLFLDYYLDPEITPTGNVSQQEQTKARQGSEALLREVVRPKSDEDEDIPAIVLMSSRRVQQYARNFRHAAGAEEIMSLRFAYLQKDWVRRESGEIYVDDKAADVLLDTSQGYLFGKLLQQALTKWKNGAKLAFSELIKAVDDLDIRDFAYLLRFRLRNEGQPLSEYLEWFFGESLKSFIDESVAWNHDSFSKLDGDQNLEGSIEGAFDGPTINAAKFYHRIKVNNHPSGTPRRNRLGDLYAQLESEIIRAVITPDCDLMVRDNSGQNDKSILTMGGTLKPFDERGSADDFFLLEEKAYSVSWKPKILKTFPFNGREVPDELNELQFLGTLQPLYAQHMQREALVDLSRVALNVAPALGINATGTVHLRKKTNGPFISLNTKFPCLATIILPREERRGQHHILLRRPFVNELIALLNDIDPDSMDTQHAYLLRKIQNGEEVDKLYEGYLRTGAQIKKSILGTGFVFGSNPDTKQDSLWLQIVLTIPEEAMEQYPMSLLNISANENAEES